MGSLMRVYYYCRDFVESGCGVKLSDERATIVSKIIAVAFGILGYGVVFLVKYLPGVLEVGSDL